VGFAVEATTVDDCGTTIKKDNSVSMWADRELRFVEPNRVSMGSESAVGDSHMP
jgi:hypothetical protein